MWLLRMDLGLCWCLILRWLIDFWKLCGPLVYKIICICEMTAYKLLPVRSRVRPFYIGCIVRMSLILLLNVDSKKLHGS